MSFPVSVIIPTYNRAHCIARSINSVLNQTYQDFEIIVIDDGSTDNTEDIVQGIFNNDNRVRYIKIENSGAAAARNFGVNLAKYEYIAFQDSDDIWLPEKLEKQVDYIDNHPNILLCYHKVRYPLANGKDYIIPDDSLDPSHYIGDVFVEILNDNLIGCPTLLVNKELFFEVGGFDTSLKALEDYDLIIRLSKGRYVGYIDEILLIAELSDGGLSHNPTNFLLAHCIMIRKYLKDYIETNTFDRTVTMIYKTAKAAGIEELIMSFLEKQIQLGGVNN